MRPSSRDACASNAFGGACLQGGISEEGSKAAQQLRSLHPAEAFSMVAWYLDDLSSGGDPQHAALLAQMIGDVAGFAAARHCAERGKAD